MEGFLSKIGATTEGLYETIQQDSSCEHGAAATHACCQQRVCRPSAFLQYHPVATCVRGFLSVPSVQLVVPLLTARPHEGVDIRLVGD